MKKFLLALLLATSILSSTAFADFIDVPETHKNSAAIEALVSQNILQGYSDSSFKPDQEVTRAEALKIILLGLGITVDDNATFSGSFSDVSTSDWYYKYVATAVNLGIVSGYDDGTFKPNQTVNRAEAIKILLITTGATLENPDEEPFADVALDAWFASYADYAKTWNIEPAQTDGRWQPAQNVSRGNISEMVYRMQIVKSTNTAFDESTNWQTKNFPTVSATLKVPYGWYYKGDGVAAVWLLDESQYSLLDPYQNGGTLLITRYSNAEAKSSSELFSDLQSSLDESTSEGTINGYPALVVYRNDGERFREWYVVLPNNSMLHFVAMRGEGFYGETLEEYLEKVVYSVNYVPGDSDAVESIRSAIQVDGSGQEAMDLLSDLELIETDSIGVGTGPVDYYYSPSTNITIKYERSFDVILDVKDGQTTAF
jgi:hypothetical protein